MVNEVGTWDSGPGFRVRARVNHQSPTHHPLDAPYDSVMDEPQLSQYLVSPRFPIQ
jgi:hypothetical protein